MRNPGIGSGLAAIGLLGLLYGCAKPTAPIETPTRSVVELAFSKVEPKLGRLTIRSTTAELEAYRGELARVRDSLTGALSANEEDDLRRDILEKEIARVDAAQAVTAGTKAVETAGREAFGDPALNFAQIEAAQSEAARTNPGSNASLALAIERVKVATRAYNQASNQIQELMMKLQKLNELPKGGNGAANG